MAPRTSNFVDQLELPTVEHPPRAFNPNNCSPGAAANSDHGGLDSNCSTNYRFAERQLDIPVSSSPMTPRSWRTVLNTGFGLVMLMGSYTFCLYIPWVFASYVSVGFVGISSLAAGGFAAGTLITQEQVDNFLTSLIFGYKVVLVFCGAVAFPAVLSTIQIMDVKNGNAIATGLHVAGLLVIFCAISSAFMFISFKTADTVTGGWNEVVRGWATLLRASSKHSQCHALTLVAIPVVFLAWAAIIYGVTLAVYFCTNSGFWTDESKLAGNNSKGLNKVEIIVVIFGTTILVGMLLQLKRLGTTTLHA